MEYIETSIKWQKGGYGMKQLWKILLIVGTVCVLIGGIFSAVLGFCFFDEIVAHKEEFVFNHLDILDWNNGFYFRNVLQDSLYYDDSECDKVLYYDASRENVENISFEFAVGKISITTGQEMCIHVENMFENAITSEVKDGTWYVKDSLRTKGNAHSEYAPDIHIVLPEGKIFDTIEIELAAGTVEAQLLRAKEIVLEVEAGTMEVQQLYAIEGLELNNGVGEMKLLSVQVNNVTADNGIGSISIFGEIKGKNHIKCGIGEVDIRLRGREEIDFDYDVNCGIGEVVIGNSNHYGIGKHHKESHHEVTSQIDYFYLDCGIGCIRLDLE